MEKCPLLKRVSSPSSKLVKIVFQFLNKSFEFAEKVVEDYEDKICIDGIFGLQLNSKTLSGGETKSRTTVTKGRYWQTIETCPRQDKCR